MGIDDRQAVWDRLSAWIEELRAPFLAASLLPVLVGAALARGQTGAWSLPLLAWTLLGVGAVHLGANVLNDYWDHRLGVDEKNTGFVRPFGGGSRIIQTGRMRPAAVLGLGMGWLAVGAASAAVLAVLRGPAVLWPAALGVVLGVGYSAPPLWLAARGLGEAAVGAAFGVLPVAGAYYVQTGSWGWRPLAASLGPSVWIAAVLLINGFQDRDGDAAAGKRTLVVRLGLRRAVWVHGSLLAAGFAAVGMAAAVGLLPARAWITLGAAPLGLAAWWVAWRRHEDGRAMAPANALTILAHHVGCALLAWGLLG